ncbi:MAG TPA: PaaI family thioesterase [Roseiarcus sp.]|nr:PaaI family thioesterase [Roseiarcus sp.]
MSAPPGFVRLEIAASFAAAFGPIYVKREDERVRYGFRVEARHLNFREVAHGGAIATFADMQLAALMRSGLLAPKQSPTISLSIDYLAPARLGDWVEGEIVLVKRTGRLAFTEAVLGVEGAPIVRAKAMFSHSEKAASLDAPPPPPPPAPPETPPPPGFAPIDGGVGFGELFGPVYHDAERRRLGFRVAARHINLFGLCHGGVVATFADYQIAPLRRAGIVSGPFAPTLSLNVDFLGPARLGEWVELEATLARATGRYQFTQALISNAAGPVARSTAIYAMTRG